MKRILPPEHTYPQDQSHQACPQATAPICLYFAPVQCTPNPLGTLISLDQTVIGNKKMALIFRGLTNVTGSIGLVATNINAGLQHETATTMKRASL